MKIRKILNLLFKLKKKNRLHIFKQENKYLVYLNTISVSSCKRFYSLHEKKPFEEENTNNWLREVSLKDIEVLLHKKKKEILKLDSKSLAEIPDTAKKFKLILNEQQKVQSLKKNIYQSLYSNKSISIKSNIEERLWNEDSLDIKYLNTDNLSSMGWKEYYDFTRLVSRFSANNNPDSVNLISRNTSIQLLPSSSENINTTNTKIKTKIKTTSSTTATKTTTTNDKNINPDLKTPTFDPNLLKNPANINEFLSAIELYYSYLRDLCLESIYKKNSFSTFSPLSLEIQFTRKIRLNTPRNTLINEFPQLYENISNINSLSNSSIILLLEDYINLLPFPKCLHIEPKSLEQLIFRVINLKSIPLKKSKYIFLFFQDLFESKLPLNPIEWFFYINSKFTYSSDPSKKSFFIQTIEQMVDLLNYVNQSHLKTISLQSDNNDKGYNLLKIENSLIDSNQQFLEMAIISLISLGLKSNHIDESRKLALILENIYKLKLNIKKNSQVNKSTRKIIRNEELRLQIIKPVQKKKLDRSIFIILSRLYCRIQRPDLIQSLYKRLVQDQTDFIDIFIINSYTNALIQSGDVQTAEDIIEYFEQQQSKNPNYYFTTSIEIQHKLRRRLSMINEMKQFLFKNNEDFTNIVGLISVTPNEDTYKPLLRYYLKNPKSLKFFTIVKRMEKNNIIISRSTGILILKGFIRQVEFNYYGWQAGAFKSFINFYISNAEKRQNSLYEKVIPSKEKLEEVLNQGELKAEFEKKSRQLNNLDGKFFLISLPFLIYSLLAANVCVRSADYNKYIWDKLYNLYYMERKNASVEILSRRELMERILKLHTSMSRDRKELGVYIHTNKDGGIKV